MMRNDLGIGMGSSENTKQTLIRLKTDDEWKE